MNKVDNLVTPPSAAEVEHWDRQRREDVDLSIRSQALTAALHTHGGAPAQAVLEAAEVYRLFLVGAADSPTVQ